VAEKIDPVPERERLAKRYAAMSVLELEKVGRDPGALTDWAFAALREMMAQRELDWVGKDLSGPSSYQAIKKQEERENIPVVVREYRDLPPAISHRMMLNAAGIDCYLYNENMVRLDWRWSNLLGGVKLVVRQKDVEDATRLLNETAIEEFAVEGIGEYRQERCPNCNSMNVFCDELMKRIAGAGLMLGVSIAMVQREWNCHDCGHAWEATKEQSAILPPLQDS
jgi:hypothetical protein